MPKKKKKERKKRKEQTFEFIFADIYRSWWVDNVGSEVVYHIHPFTFYLLLFQRGRSAFWLFFVVVVVAESFFERN